MNFTKLLELLEQQSPTIIAVFIVGFILFRYIQQQHKEHLESKDKEIERLVKEKNELHKMVLKERLSTNDAKGKGGKS